MRKVLPFLLLLLAGPVLADEIFPVVHCRMVDTRWTSPPIYLALSTEYTFNARLSDNSAQGGEPGSCGIPAGASAIVASIVTVSPAGPGYLKAWATGGPEPARATALNFFKAWDAAVGSYPISPGRLAVIPLSPAGDFSLEAYWFGAYVTVDVEAYLKP